MERLYWERRHPPEQETGRGCKRVMPCVPQHLTLNIFGTQHSMADDKGEGTCGGQRSLFLPGGRQGFLPPGSRMTYSLLGNAESSNGSPDFAQQIPSCPQACVRAGFQKEAHASQDSSRAVTGSK